MNTMLIIANQGHDSNSYAAGLCANLVITNAGVDYGDWYLPSEYKLNLMYLNIGPGGSNVGGFANDTYWSSTEEDRENAKYNYFYNGSQFNTIKDSDYPKVRAVRAF